MIRNFVLLFNFLGVAIFTWFAAQEINVSMQVPAEVHGGQEFQVTLIIDKGSLESFSRFTQELPYGLTAKRVSTANGDFTFEDQRVRLIWLKLPAEPKLEVTYVVNVDKRLKGSFTLKGELSFIEQNERKNIIVVGGHEIRIIPDSTVADSMLVDIHDFAKMAPELLSPGNENLTVLREDPVQTGAHEFTVSLLVKKNHLDKFAKIEEYLPAGFRAVEGDSKDGIFSFSQGTAKILWMNLPPEPEFVVTYKIIPDPGKKLSDLNISGSFSYIAGNQSKTVAVVAKNFNLAEEETDKDTTSGYVAAVQETNPANETTGPTETGLVKTAAETPKGLENKSHLLQPAKGIYYRVQLAAGHKKINIDTYFKKRKVTDPVMMEFHEGWQKYTTGSFDIYHDARNYRVKIWNTTPIKDAFVSAYNNGTRITVQEALMISSQKWYP